MSLSKVGLVVAGAAAAGALVVGGSALADAATGSSSGTSTGAYGRGGGAGGAGGPGGPGRPGEPGEPGEDGRPQGGFGRGGGSQDTAVTGDEATRVRAAVIAKDSAVSVTSVRKDPDGSYDVLGTKDGSPVFYDVSKDLATVTLNTFPGGGPGRGGRDDGGRDDGRTSPEASASSTT